MNYFAVLHSREGAHSRESRPIKSLLNSDKNLRENSLLKREFDIKFLVSLRLFSLLRKTFDWLARWRDFLNFGWGSGLVCGSDKVNFSTILYSTHH